MSFLPLELKIDNFTYDFFLLP